jgi:hypothetical protein
MATQTITISSKNPVQILTNANLTTSTIANLDATNSVYLGSDPSGTSGGFELTAGSVISWDMERALYAFVLGSPVKMVVLDNGGNFNNGVAVANALIASGLATAIANAIVASALAANTATAVATSSLANNTANATAASTLAADTAAAIAGSLLPQNTASQINLFGIPAIDVPIQLYSSVSGVNDTWGSGFIQIAKYQSLEIRVVQSSGDPLPRSYRIDFYDNIGNIIDSLQFSGVANGPAVLEIPAKGASISILTNRTGVAFTGSIFVTGSYRTVNSTSWHTMAGGSIPEPIVVAALGNGTVINTPQFFSYYATTPANFGPLIYPILNSCSGNLHLTARHNGSAGNMIFSVRDRRSNAWIIAPLAITVAAGIVTADCNVGYRPIDISLQCAGVIGDVSLTLGIL